MAPALARVTFPVSGLQTSRSTFSRRPFHRHVGRVASVDPSVIADLADQVAPGSVEAPISAVVASTIVISAAVLLGVTFALKPGTDAAIKMQERDSKTGRWRK
jgi:hypothetical protein